MRRVVCAIDCGLAVNPNLIAQQMESGTVFGLTAALYGEVSIEGGRVQQSNFHDQPALRINECPQIVCGVLPAPSDDAHPELPKEAVELIQLWVQQSSCAFLNFLRAPAFTSPNGGFLGVITRRSAVDPAMCVVR